MGQWEIAAIVLCEWVLTGQGNTSTAGRSDSEQSVSAAHSRSIDTSHDFQLLCVLRRVVFIRGSE